MDNSLSIQHWEEGLGEGRRLACGTASPTSGLWGFFFRKTHLSLLSFPPQSSFTSALLDLSLFRKIQPPLFVLGPSLLSAMNPEAGGQPGSVGGIRKDAGEERDAVNPGRERVGFGKKSLPTVTHLSNVPGTTLKITLCKSSIMLEQQRGFM